MIQISLTCSEITLFKITTTSSWGQWVKTDMHGSLDLKNEGNTCTMPTDALAPCLAQVISSHGTYVTLYNKQALVFYKKGFLQPVPSQY